MPSNKKEEIKPKKTTTTKTSKAKVSAKTKTTKAKVSKASATSAKASPKKTSTKKTSAASVKSSPTTKKTSSTSKKAVSTTKKVASTAPKSSPKPNTKASAKAKPVVIEVISDDKNLKDSESFISDESLNKDDFKIEEIQESREADLIGEDFFSSLEDKIELQAPNEDLDRQKQFFSDLVSDLKTKQGSDGDLSDDISFVQPRSAKNLKLYRRLVWNFLLLVGFLIIVVAYFSFTKLTIYITPQVEAMNDILFLRVEDNSNLDKDLSTGDARELIIGTVGEIELSAEKKYIASGEEYLNEEIIGKVTIVNNNNKDQALVATTRLLSPDGKLFRIKEGVTVSAGSKVDVEIYADKVSPEMAINPSHFTIPGLWVGLQDKIYAESKEAFKFQRKIEKYVQASDIQLANSEAANLLLSKAKDLRPLNSDDKLIYQISEPIATELKVKAGDKQESFNMVVKAKVSLISFSEQELMNLAQSKFNLLLPDDKELLEIKPDSFTYNLESVDLDEKTALVKVNNIGLIVLKSNAEIIDKSSLKQLSADQINNYLKNFPEIGQYELEFKPAFIKKAPYLVDRIKIKIKSN